MLLMVWKNLLKQSAFEMLSFFVWWELLPKKPGLFYYGQWIRSSEYDTFDFTGFIDQYNRSGWRVFWKQSYGAYKTKT